MERIIAVNSNCYHGYRIEDAISGIKAAGFRYIELTATKGWTEHVFPTFTFQKLLRIQDELTRAKLIPFSMSGHCNLMDQNRLDDFVDNIRLAAFFGCSYIVSSVGEAHLEDQAVVDNGEVARHLKGIIPYLERYHIQLVLETHGAEHGSGKVLTDIVKRVGSPFVKVNFDTANVLFYGNVDLQKDLDESMKSIAYMHLKDKAGERTEWNFPALGKGYVNFPMIFDMLKKANNNCPFSVEIEFTQAGPRDLNEVNQAVQDSAEYLIAQGFVL